MPALRPSTIKRPALTDLHDGEFKEGVIIIKKVRVEDTVIMVRNIFLGKWTASHWKEYVIAGTELPKIRMLMPP